jgi:hypothetical protein
VCGFFSNLDTNPVLFLVYFFGGGGSWFPSAGDGRRVRDRDMNHLVPSITHRASQAGIAWFDSSAETEGDSFQRPHIAIPSIQVTD